MQTKLVTNLNKSLTWCFYAIFFLVPLVMYPTTFELFEFNKIWILFGISLIIFLLWFSKIVITGEFKIRRTPLDFPLLLFLLSQIISSIFSLDPYVSFWGYYSRFNGGLLSTITYIFLYYAFASNLTLHTTSEKLQNLASYRVLLVSLISGVCVALWGLPSHFGYDPTCLVFRGTLDVSCWSESFHPTVRIFSTLGQPNWLASYIAIIFPVLLICIISFFEKIKKNESSKIFLFIASLIALYIFYFNLLYARSQSGFLGFLAGMAFFTTAFFLIEAKLHGLPSMNSLSKWLKDISSQISHNKMFLSFFVICFSLLIVSFFSSVPIGFLEQYTFKNIKNRFTPKVSQPTTPAAPSTSAPPMMGEIGGTDSGKIRKVVWLGALEIFKQNPLFGTGVETFAYAYYKVKPKEHNLTSEWDFLYNKAHNEYLNYLATSGAFGLGSYLLIIVYFFYIAVKTLIYRENHTRVDQKATDKHPNAVISLETLLLLALMASYISILISNFFGFSVVIVNLYFFFIPLFFFEIEGSLLKKPIVLFNMYKKKDVLLDEFRHTKFRSVQTENQTLPPLQLLFISIAALTVLYFEFLLFRYWYADQRYALGYNLNRVQQYTQAYQPLLDAVQTRPSEDLFKDELSVNMATLAFLYAQENQATEAAIFEQGAKKLSDEVVRNHPNNVVYYKTRTKVLYTLAQLNKNYLPLVLESIEKAHQLAPTDAKIVYNIALIYAQEGEKEKALEYIKQAMELKPNYVDAYYAYGLYNSELATQKESSDPASAAQHKREAIEKLEFALKTIDPNHTEIKKLLDTLK